MRREPRRSWAPLGLVGAIAAVFVASFLIGSQVLRPVPQDSHVAVIPTLVPTAALSPSSPGPTPLKVVTSDVAWAEQPKEANSTRIVTSSVPFVCPAGSTDCAPIESSGTVVTVPVAASSIWTSPSQQQVVVVGRGSGTSTSSVFVANVDGSSVVSPSPSPSGSGSQATETPSVEPSATPSGSPASAPPTEQASTSPSTEASPSVTPVPASASPTEVANLLAIATDVVVIGQSAAYSPDGNWFAFTARPAGTTVGPDIYRWHVGAAAAQAVTTDHRSIFSGWAGNLVLGSHVESTTVGSSPSEAPTGSSSPVDASSSPEASASPSAAPPASASPSGTANPSEATPHSFVIDPTTGASTEIAAPVWRPVVDPTGRFVVYWDGSVAAEPSTDRWQMGTGRLVVASWDELQAGATGGDLHATALPQTLSVDHADWDVQWDESGTHLAVWIGEQASADLGRVSFLTVDQASGSISQAGPQLQNEPALRGIALTDGHLAWATPSSPGQQSKLKLYAWNGAEAGIRDGGATGEKIVVVH
jgi:hypothetical protein